MGAAEPMFLRKVGEVSFEVCGIPLRRGPLFRLLRRAQRSKVLFKCLSVEEIRFVNLAFRVVDEVRSFMLAKALAPIVRRLLDALQVTRELMIYVLGEVNYWLREAGRVLAEKVTWIAQSWGHGSAHKWLRDEGFIKYLTIISIPHLREAERLGSILG